MGEAADGMDAIRLTRQLAPSVVLMDIRMPNMDGLAAARVILAETESRVLMLTTFDTDEYVYSALRAGASGFLLKDAPGDQLAAAVRSVAAGNALSTPDHPAVDPAFRCGQPTSSGGTFTACCPHRSRTEVLRLLARGLSNAEIAAELVVEESTVKTHVARVLMKLNLRDRVQAVVFAYECGFVVADAP